MRRRQRRMRGNLPGPEGLAGRGASAALHGLPVVPPRAAPRALHPLPLPANAAHAEYSDRLLGVFNMSKILALAGLRCQKGRGFKVHAPDTGVGPRQTEQEILHDFRYQPFRRKHMVRGDWSRNEVTLQIDRTMIRQGG